MSPDWGFDFDVMWIETFIPVVVGFGKWRMILRGQQRNSEWHQIVLFELIDDHGRIQNDRVSCLSFFVFNRFRENHRSPMLKHV